MQSEQDVVPHLMQLRKFQGHELVTCTGWKEHITTASKGGAEPVLTVMMGNNTT